MLSHGGTRVSFDRREIDILPKPEYQVLYERFAELILGREQDVDLAPLQHVADAFMLGERRSVAPFSD